MDEISFELGKVVEDTNRECYVIGDSYWVFYVNRETGQCVYTSSCQMSSSLACIQKGTVIGRTEDAAPQILTALDGVEWLDWRRATSIGSTILRSALRTVEYWVSKDWIQALYRNR